LWCETKAKENTADSTLTYYKKKTRRRNHKSGKLLEKKRKKIVPRVRNLVGRDPRT